MLLVKNLPANSGDAREAGLIPGSGWFPGGGNGNLLSSILAWKISWTKELGGLQSTRSESDANEWQALSLWSIHYLSEEGDRASILIVLASGDSGWPKEGTPSPVSTSVCLFVVSESSTPIPHRRWGQGKERDEATPQYMDEDCCCCFVVVLSDSSVTPWNVACWAPLSISCIAGRFFTTKPLGKPYGWR